VTRLSAGLRGLPSWQVTLGVALLALGFLIAAQLRAEGPRVRYTTQERSPLVETAVELTADQDALKARILDLNGQIAMLQGESEGSAALVRGVNARLEEARVAAGLVALEGPGIVLQLSDSAAPPPTGANPADFLVGGRDIRAVVEELWLAGAEAISVNQERLTPSSAILDIGGAILVNSAYLAQPYQLTAIGPADLFDRLSASAGFADFVRARAEAYGIGVSVAEPGSVVVPAYAGSVTLRYSTGATDGETP
jgi:uncharacterized protein YlxW (UPF0749 family)